jgi:sterol desaturase/sphingolipid hydroxylase (fatty acid hydroxylase superfamily)
VSRFLALAKPVIVWPREQWISLAIAAVIAAVLYAIRWTRREPLSAAGVLRFIAPPSIYRHSSSIVDYKYFLSLAVVQPVLATLLVAVSTVPLTKAVTRLLTLVLGDPGRALAPTTLVRVGYAVALMLAADFGYFVFHYLAHKSAILWEFHKVHHAAEVLNPLTTYRNHPVDMVVQQLFIAFAIAPVNGIAAYVTVNGGLLAGERLMTMSVVVYLLTATAHLRHTHVWLSYGPVGNRILSSPAQHQIHHSCELRHIDTNFGRTFSLWDWMFGTIYDPAEREEFALGLRDAEQKEYTTLRACYVLPFVKAWRVVTAHRIAVVAQPSTVAVPEK